MEEVRLGEVEKILRYEFRDKGLLRLALTHTSYTKGKETGGYEHNERLEFLGDSVLSMVLTEYLFVLFKGEPEGVLAKYKAALVKGEYLAKIAKGLGLNGYILLGGNEQRSGGQAKKSILEDALEAIIAAVYLDSNYERVREFIKEVLYPDLKENLPTIIVEENPKGELQERLSKISADLVPEYRTLRHEGPDHDRDFYVQVEAGGKVLGKGEGRSIKKAQEMAAREALEMGLPPQTPLGD